MFGLGSKDLAQIGIFASLYAALVYLFAPISFQELQFRVADILPPAIARKWKLAIGYALGCVAANVVSPFSGAWELIFMPFMSFVAGIFGYLAARICRSYDYYIFGVVHAAIIALSVSFMLYQLFNIPMYVTFPMLLVSEQIVNFIGASLFKAIEKRWVWW